MEKKDPAATRRPTICDRIQKAFNTRPAFRPLRRLTAPLSATPAQPPLKPVAAGAPGPISAPLTESPAKPDANQVEKPQVGRVPSSSRPTADTTATATAEKAAMTATEAAPVATTTPAPSVAGRPSEGVQPARGKSRIGSRVRKSRSSK